MPFDLPPHLAALHQALKLEEAHERDTLAQLAKGSLADRVALGVSFPKLTVADVHRSGRRFIARLRAPQGVVLHDHIGAGNPVSVYAGSKATHGVSLGHDGRVVEVACDDELPEGAQVELRQRADPRTWIQYRQALEKGAILDSPLSRTLLGQPLAALRWSEPDAPINPAHLRGLNPAQEMSVRRALDEPTLSAIHGPPGTGKTHVLGAILSVLVERGERPWALADSNAAVDHLALTAFGRGLHVVRIGHPARIEAAAAELSLDAHMARSPLASAIALLERDIRRTDDHWERRSLVKEVQALRNQARAHIFAEAQVIASTFGSLVRRAADLPSPTTAVVDEATQATEPAVWVAVPFIDRLILAGDPEQLGPVTKVPGSALERSLLQRVIEDDVVDAPMLEVQHRMNTPLRELVAEVYGPAYTDHPAVAERHIHELANANDAVLQNPALWIDTAGAGFEEHLDPLTRSLQNRGEASVVALVVEALQSAGVAAEHIAVLAPYSAQVALLSAILPEMNVSTVNAFQGREVEVLVVSWVRSNPDGQLGFVADPRRLTVSLTRARRLLIQIGDSATLAGHPRFAAVLDRIADSDGLQSVFEPPWDAALG